MADAVFIDTSNLNVMYKVNGTFVLGVNYDACPDRIAIDTQALGASYDVYLSVWPRQRGESKDVINALSIGGVPFVVDKEEIVSVLNLVDKAPGVGNIYVCNALANFVIQARVSNFQSVINYGNRVALITVKDKLLEDLRIYDSQEELYADKGDDFFCYGDLDLIDVDAIKSQYEELTRFNKSTLVPLAHLITSYHSSYNVDMDTVQKELRIGPYFREGEEDAPEPESNRERKPKRKQIEPVYDDDDVEERIQHRKPGVSLLNVLLIAIALAGCGLTGFGFAFSGIADDITQAQAEVAPYQAEAAKYDMLTGVYTAGGGYALDLSEVVGFAKANTLGFNVAGADAMNGGFTLRCNTTNAEAKEAFQAYLESKYVVGEFNSLDATQGPNGSTVYNYSVVIVRQ